MDKIRSTVAFISSDMDSISVLKNLFIHAINMNVYKNKPNARWIGNFFSLLLKGEFEDDKFICQATVEHISALFNPVDDKYCFIIRIANDYPPIHALESFIGILFKKKIEISYTLEYETVGENVMDMYFNTDPDKQIIYGSNVIN